MSELKEATQADVDQQYPVTPLGVQIDLQPGANGEPWVRVQISSIAISATFVFPPEFSESVIDKFTEGIRSAAQQATKQSGLSLPNPNRLVVP